MQELKSWRKMRATAMRTWRARTVSVWQQAGRRAATRTRSPQGTPACSSARQHCHRPLPRHRRHRPRYRRLLPRHPHPLLRHCRPLCHHRRPLPLPPPHSLMARLSLPSRPQSSHLGSPSQQRSPRSISKHRTRYSTACKRLWAATTRRAPLRCASQLPAWMWKWW